MPIGEALASFIEGDAHAPYPSPHNEAAMRETAAETYEKMQDLVTSMAKAQREGLMGLMGRVNEMLDGLPEGCFVAVSPADVGDITSGVANVAYTLRALMPGMPVPEGWTAYARR